MNKHPWRQEWLRLFAALFLVPLIYIISDQLWLAIFIVASIYIGFLWLKLYEIHIWLQQGLPDDKSPNGSGVLGHLITLIYRYKTDSETAHTEQIALTKQFRGIMAAMPSATIILNKNNEIEWANSSALTLLGINGRSDVGITIDLLLRQPDFITFLHRDNFEQFEIQSPISHHQTLAIQLVQYADQKRLILAHNITPHIEVQRSRKTFIANASHELRTPLTVIAGYLEFMHSDENLPPSLSFPVEKAIEQAHNMEILINDLLVLSKLEDKQQYLTEISHINLKSHLDSIIQTLEAGGKTQHHKLITKVESNKLTLDANEKELNSVCFNLINNAIKYSEPNSEIRITWEKTSAHQIKFSVRDQGIGIAPQHISHLTERFYRVDSGRSRRVGGTGLGLSIVKHILERHNGRLEIHSTLGKGSIFSAIFAISADS